MKIILVIDRVLTGGAERILVDYYHYLEDYGHEPYVFALSGNSSQSKWTEGLNITYGFGGDEENLVKKTFQQLMLFVKLRRLVKNVRPDGIFSFLEKSNLLTIFVPAGRANKVVSVHNVLSIQYRKVRNKLIRKILYKMIEFAYNRGIKVVAVSKQVKNDLVENFYVKSQNIDVVNNYVDCDDVKRKAVEHVDDFFFDPNSKYVLTVGRFCNQKAQWKLVKAFSYYAKKTQENVHLILIGAGDYSEHLKKLAFDLGITGKVSVLPFNVNPYKYMSKAHVFALSSIYEGFPIVLAEISSLRIPFIGSRKAVPEEMFSSIAAWDECVFNSVTFEPDFSTTIHEDEIALAELLRNAVENEDFRRRNLQETAAWEKSNCKINQFSRYDGLVGIE